MANSRGGLLDLPDRRGEASTFLPCTVCQTSYQAPHIGYNPMRLPHSHPGKVKTGTFLGQGHPAGKGQGWAAHSK